MRIIFFLISFIFVAQANSTYANTNLAFIDLDKILSTSKPGSSIINQLDKVNNLNLKNFQNQANNLKKKETKLISQKNILSNEDFESSINNLKIEIEKYNNDRNKIINEFNQMKIVNTNTFLKMINPILMEYSNQESIAIIFHKKDLIIGKTELDITDEIIKIINIKVAEFKIQ
tara:strand:+ start:3277 stop:3798 length:522 start_codon:yes stop_codon:yes gene_type:complete